MGFSSGGRDQPSWPQRDLNSDAHGLPSNSLKPSTEATKSGQANCVALGAMLYSVLRSEQKGESDIHLQLCLRSASPR